MDINWCENVETGLVAMSKQKNGTNHLLFHQLTSSLGISDQLVSLIIDFHLSDKSVS